MTAEPTIEQAVRDMRARLVSSEPNRYGGVDETYEYRFTVTAAEARRWCGTLRATLWALTRAP